MVFAMQGYTKEFIALQADGVGVEYLGEGSLPVKYYLLMTLFTLDFTLILSMDSESQQNGLGCFALKQSFKRLPLKKSNDRKQY